MAGTGSSSLRAHAGRGAARAGWYARSQPAGADAKAHTRPACARRHPNQFRRASHLLLEAAHLRCLTAPCACVCAAGVEVTCLGLCPASHCLLIDVHDGPRILVDCPLEPLGMKNFPVSRHSGPDGAAVLGDSSHHLGGIHTAQLAAVDPATVDCVIITNFHNMLALPYVTESAAGFRGIVLATEPTAEFGKLSMLELAEFIATTSFGSVPTAEGEWATSEGGLDLGPGRQPYTAAQVEACMEKVVRLNYMQSKATIGGFSLTPWASGAPTHPACVHARPLSRAPPRTHRVLDRLGKLDAVEQLVQRGHHRRVVHGAHPPPPAAPPAAAPRPFGCGYFWRLASAAAQPRHWHVAGALAVARAGRVGGQGHHSGRRCGSLRCSLLVVVAAVVVDGVEGSAWV